MAIRSYTCSGGVGIDRMECADRYVVNPGANDARR